MLIAVRQELASSTRWTLDVAVAVCCVPIPLALIAYLETQQPEWLVALLGSAWLAVGVGRMHLASMRLTATLLMSLGVTMPIGAASPLAAVDVVTQPWNAWATAIYVCGWLAAAILLTLLGWQLEQARAAVLRSQRAECGATR
jgi:hypothetical protein